MFYRQFGKRCLDAVAALVGLILLAPVFAIAAIVVKWTSPGPVFFRQDRVGVDGKLFKIYKFRSMFVRPASGNSFLTAAGDPRITKCGAWLRRTKIDELPQLLNVILGDMSLVGPRPEVIRYINFYNERQKNVLHVRPGMTGASINIYEEELLASQTDKEAFYIRSILPAKLEIDLDYCETISLWNDLKLIAGTFPMIVGRLNKSRVSRNAVKSFRSRPRKDFKVSPAFPVGSPSTGSDDLKDEMLVECASQVKQLD